MQNRFINGVNQPIQPFGLLLQRFFLCLQRLQRVEIGLI
jgi:hypothetical protein